MPPGPDAGVSANSGKSLSATSCIASSRLYGGWTFVDQSVGNLVGNSVQAVDEAVLSRLRNAIAVDDGGEEVQLKGVLRMLGAEIPNESQIPLFGKAPGEAPKP